MNSEHLIVLPLHKMPELMKDCCSLINSEWPRSKTARMRSLECSKDTLPTSLILVKKKKVIGHCKLSRIPSDPTSCFVESVVIAHQFRGLRLGSYLMKKTEEYCRTFLNLSTIYLSTKGQEEFYAKLGYTECEPISIYGFSACYNGSMDERMENVSTVHNGLGPPPPPMPVNAPNITKLTSSKTFMKKDLQKSC